MQELLSKLQSCLQKGQDCVLVSLIADDGSAPRSAGAQMLVTNGGRLHGSIGGGEVEYLAIREALSFLEKRSCGRKDYVFRKDGGNTEMICGGEVTALFLFVPSGNAAWAEFLSAALKRISLGLPGLLLYPEDGSQPSLLDMDGEALSGPAREYRFASLRPRFEGGIFLLPLELPDRAILFGAGHIAEALAPLLSKIGFRVTVYDDRPEFARRERFPDAEAVLLGDYGKLSENLDLKDRDYLLVLTNGHKNDLAVLEQLLPKKYAYLGTVGSRKKRDAANQKLRENGFSEKAISSIHCPIGLPIDAATPAEIAVSIAAELIQIRARLRVAAGAAPVHKQKGAEDL